MGWALTLATDLAWTVTLYNYDGEMGATPPPSLFLTVVTSAVIATALMAMTWLAWRVANQAGWPFWRVLLAGFLVKGCLFAGAELASLAIYGPAPFTVGGFCRGAALDIITPIVSGGLVAFVVRAIGSQRLTAENAVEDNFT